MTETIRIEGLTRRYGRTVAVSGVDLAVEDSEIFGLVGPNGAGKTTTLRMLATLLVPSERRRADHGPQHPPRAGQGAAGHRLHARHASASTTTCASGSTSTSSPAATASRAARRKRLIGDLLELVDLAPQARRLRPVALAGHAATAVPRPCPRPRPAGAAARRAGLGPRPARAHRAARAAPRAARHGQDRAHQQPHPPRARGAVHRVAIIDHGRVLAHGEVAEIERPAAAGCGARASRSLGDADAVAAAERAAGRRPMVTSATTLPDGRIELGLPGRRGGHGRPAGPARSAMDTPSPGSRPR